MKKFHFIILLVVLPLSLMFFSCNKSEPISSQNTPSNTEIDDQNQNEATWTSSGQEKGATFSLKLTIGHTVQQCGGKCIKIFGDYGHIDCRGFGNICNFKVNANYLFFPNDNGGTLTLDEVNELGDDLVFPFPNRSLKITNPQNNNDLWLNIPEQVLTRTNVAESFILLGVWFSENPELVNE